MERKKLFCQAFVLHVVFLLLNPGCPVAGQVQEPQALIGHKLARRRPGVGADYKLARYEKIREYFYHVGKNSPRVNVREIGLTTEGQKMIIAEITDDATPEQIKQAMANQKKTERFLSYIGIADPRLIKDQAHEQDLIANAKVVVLVNCNLHSTEIASATRRDTLTLQFSITNRP